ncbi:unnamed protein product [Didymodactylos carnosus]|uniref:Uncharacterized protein n=2 Tax=Didymodactylos carnosus TaxID=1234261 RepID=A0A816EPQ9_9BILA|nr:unnamed protein product [Didymodactylos carnosus]CAF4582697.1 unnamed protein product [Didymodactylos carnosus]
MLASMCYLTNGSIYDNLNLFYSILYITPTVVPYEIFQVVTQSYIDVFVSTITNSFIRSIQMIQITTQGNGLLSALQTDFSLNINFTVSTLVLLSSKSYNNSCSCHTMPACIEQIVVASLSEPMHSGQQRGH